ncbi:hypothetical protein EVAR_7303_1 [Eumeta japonica]|uniref:Uncharacterized protein n=1 Tax=Eumeta variegata TaxID=151549 RepID=A0A4C1T3E8_EUMVA|nr:hypothetical protein EVAR_7303_1 [Eumeta japonica]
MTLSSGQTSVCVRPRLSRPRLAYIHLRRLRTFASVNYVGVQDKPRGYRCALYRPGNQTYVVPTKFVCMYAREGRVSVRLCGQTYRNTSAALRSPKPVLRKSRTCSSYETLDLIQRICTDLGCGFSIPRDVAARRALRADDVRTSKLSVDPELVPGPAPINALCSAFRSNATVDHDYNLVEAGGNSCQSINTPNRRRAPTAFPRDWSPPDSFPTTRLRSTDATAELYRIHPKVHEL